MDFFVYRNDTVERFFPKNFSFSGYGDISSMPSDADGFIWFYQMPVKYDVEALSDEIRSYAQKASYVLSQVPSDKVIIALTMSALYNVSFSESDRRVEDAIDFYNSSLYSLSGTADNVKILDFSEFTSLYPADELVDWKFYFMSQMGLNPHLSASFKKWFERKLDGIALKRQKCLVLDLDNTLWGGVLGEDGIFGIKIGGDYPGKAFSLFQQGLAELSKNGVILTVCSKNNEADVLDAWKQNPEIVLTDKYISAYRINWNNKADNIRELAAELNIGLDSMVFVDDNPSERELVRQMLPMVKVPDFPEHPYELPIFFKMLSDDYFRVYSVTQEDLEKTLQYKANALRNNEQLRFSDFSEYLRSLELNLKVEAASDITIARIAQMTQKTNQFNLTTRRYSEADVRKFLSNGWRIWCVDVSDKFGDSGVTGVIFVKPCEEGSAEIDSLLLSCRVLGKGIEKAFLKTVLRVLKGDGVERVCASYIPTSKNSQVRDFYSLCGFEQAGKLEGDAVRFSIELSEADLSIEDYYKIEVI